MAEIRFLPPAATSGKKQEKARTTLEMVLAFFITDENLIFALIDGGDESYSTLGTYY